MSTMPDNQIAALKLQFARQLYDKCLERHGKHHEQTRIMSRYISALENRDSLAARDGGTLRRAPAGFTDHTTRPSLTPSRSYVRDRMLVIRSLTSPTPAPAASQSPQVDIEGDCGISSIALGNWIDDTESR